MHSLADATAAPVSPVAQASLASRAGILALQDAMVERLKELGEPHDGTDHLCPVVDYFAPGIYARQITIPAGMVIVGKIHRHAHVSTLSKGRMVVVTEFERQEISAPYTWVAPAGTKRAVVTLEEVVLTNYHANPSDETDIARIEEMVIAPSFEAFDMGLLA